jgi:hypothetical protein
VSWIQYIPKRTKAFRDFNSYESTWGLLNATNPIIINARDGNIDSQTSFAERASQRL